MRKNAESQDAPKGATSTTMEGSLESEKRIRSPEEKNTVKSPKKSFPPSHATGKMPPSYATINKKLYRDEMHYTLTGTNKGLDNLSKDHLQTIEEMVNNNILKAANQFP